MSASSTIALLNEGAEGSTSTCLPQLLDTLEQQTQQVRYSLLSSVRDCLKDNSRHEEVEEVFSALLADIGFPEGSPEAELQELARQHKELQSQLHQVAAEVNALQTLSHLETQLTDFRRALADGEYRNAAYVVVQLDKTLEDSKSSGAEEGDGPSPWSTLEEASSDCRSKLARALDHGLTEACSTSEAGKVLTLRSHTSGGVALFEVWQALHVLGGVKEKLAAMAQTILQQHLRPYLGGQYQLVVQQEYQTPAVTFSWVPSADLSCASDHLERSLTSLIEWTAHQVFSADTHLVKLMGDIFWRNFCQLYEKQCIPQVVQEGVTPDQLSIKLTSLRQLEAKAAELGYFEPGSSNLGQALEKEIKKLHYTQQHKYLSQARALLVRMNFSETITVGQAVPVDGAFYQRLQNGQLQDWEIAEAPCGWDCQGPILARGRYQISTSVKDLVELIDRVLLEACNSDTAKATALVAAVVNMSLMLRTLPLVVCPQLEEVPQLALVHYNGLMHVAEHLLLTPMLLAPKLQKALGGDPELGPCITTLLVTARQLLASQVHQQLGMIKEEMIGLLELKSGARGSLIVSNQKRAMAQVLMSLQRIGRVLSDVLTPAATLSVASPILQHVGSSLLNMVLAKEDIGVEEGEVIEELLQPLVEGGLAAVLGSGGEAGQGGKVVTQLQYLMAEGVLHRSPAFAKLRSVVDLLKKNMADIEELWESGKLQGLGWKLEEVKKFICAVFEATDRRAECLLRLEAVSD